MCGYNDLGARYDSSVEYNGFMWRGADQAKGVGPRQVMQRQGARR